MGEDDIVKNILRSFYGYLFKILMVTFEDFLQLPNFDLKIFNFFLQINFLVEQIPVTATLVRYHYYAIKIKTF